MRVTLGSQMDYAKANMSASYARLVRLQELVASGKKVSRPSHDPVAANQSLYYTQQLADIEQYLRNAGIAKDFMARTSVALDEVYSQIQSAIGDARSSINATMSRAAREGLAAKLDALLERLRDVADTRHLGRYIFSGHRTDSPPVALEHRFTGTGAFVPQATGGTLTINGVAIAVEPGDTAAALIARINQRSGLHRVTARDNGAGGVELRMAHPDGGNVIQVAVSGGYTLDQIFGTAPVETVGTGFTYGGGDGSVRIQVSPSTVVSASTTAHSVQPGLGGRAGRAGPVPGHPGSEAGHSGRRRPRDGARHHAAGGGVEARACDAGGVRGTHPEPGRDGGASGTDTGQSQGIALQDRRCRRGSGRGGPEDPGAGLSGRAVLCLFSVPSDTARLSEVGGARRLLGGLFVMNLVTRFGEIEIEEKSCIQLKDGLVGLPQAKRFCLLSHREDSPFLWLQCLDEPALSLAVINPMDFFNDYEFDLQDADVEALGLTSAEDAVVLTTVTVDEEGRVTTNLLGPIVVNRRTLAAKQVVLSSENYSPRHLLFQLKPKPEGAAKEAGTRAA